MTGLKLIRPSTALGYLRDTFNRYGDVVKYRFGPLPVYLVAHPDGVKHILQDNHTNYTKSQDYAFLKVLLGEGLVTSEGALWLRQRRLIQPAFHKQRIEGFSRIMIDETLEMLDSWEKLAAEGTPVDIQREMMRVTLKIVGKALLSIDLTNEADAVGAAMKTANERFEHFDLAMFIPSLPTRRNREFNAAVNSLKNLVDGIIASRRRESRDYGDLLSMLLAVRDEETGEGMSDQQLRDEILTLILAGHETTATALSWTFHLLTQHSDVREKLEAELNTVLGGKPPSFADLRNLSYTGMVIDETMRLYPSVWAIGRSPLEDDEVNGFRLPKKSMILLSQYVTHRHPKFWDDPDRFDPERFSAERSQGRPAYAFFPFAGGPRKCIGYLFALTEANLILAAVAQQFRMRAVPGHPIELQPLVTLRPRYGIKVTLEKIGGAAPARRVA
ncbi:MAG TPA: cytochrome P450 [Candidatus Binataceae bacterium]|nr:cytochrome P450 [Candidatus Binataceae bacterium]